jgi:uncharacterized protein (TIGR03000 family)
VQADEGSYDVPAPPQAASPVKAPAGRPAPKLREAPREGPKQKVPAADQPGASEQIGLPEEIGKAPATIVVRVPAGARLLVNNVATQQSSGPRKLVSPPLERGKDFHYTLKAEIVQDGRVLTTTKRIAVRAGEVKRVTLGPAAPAAATPAAGAARVPPAKGREARGDPPRATSARVEQPGG